MWKLGGYKRGEKGGGNREGEYRVVSRGERDKKNKGGIEPFSHATNRWLAFGS